ncbi:tetratricopeptide repeat protein [Nakamurella flavida]|uniref:Tetratricopeptide repeat protein n=1 Tax=Nakamurella flavida TaxID=363630 RepID=A0A938YF24_9ACTN|nr:tetratricopeptide repeat protein [Nakamurella flavida]MBM9476496.1 tetratricopeptide repeat protein [Nakamurella flavida]MDP9779067.1 tetratricopeptide (TPR) repeat protein [Nakamurella flavida]
MTELINYYEILDLDAAAETADIERAVKVQQRKWQQRQLGPTVERQRQAEDRIRLIDRAQQELLDPLRRRRHDADLAAAAAAAAAPAHPPPPAAGSPTPAPVDWLGRARGFLQAGDAESAAYAAREATEQRPGEAQAWAVRGEASRAMGRTREALFEFREALRLDRQPEYLVHLAGELEKAGRLKEALEAWHDAAGLAPTQPVFPMNAARVLARQGERAEAVAILEELRRRFPDRPEVAGQLAWVLSERVQASWSVLHDGSSTPTTARQVEVAQRDLAEALALPGAEGPLTERLLAQAAEVERATRSVWTFPPRATGGQRWLRRIGWFLLAWFSVAIPQSMFPRAEWLGTVLGLLCLAAVVWGFVKLYRRPRWQTVAKSGAVARPGI